MTGSRNLSGDRDQTKSEALEHRMLIFAAGIIKEIKLQKDLPFSVIDQLIRSAASIGANYAEACNASSKMDFRNKIFIAKKEAAETRYWIKLSMELNKSDIWDKHLQESRELILILQTIINTLRTKSDK